MCVLIHKPAGVAVPEPIIQSAALHNADGWGVMGHTADGDTVLERHVDVDAARTIDFLRSHTDSELAIHLRRRTHGDVNACNAHPFEIEPGLYLMHNGSFTLPMRDPTYSDTWHLVHNILRPLARRHRDLITDPTFLELISAVAGPVNRLILFDASRPKLHLVNRQIGVDYAGLWIGSLKWLDAGLFDEASAVGCAA